MYKLYLSTIFLIVCILLVFIKKSARSEEVDSEVGCLVEAVYFEARSESFIGQLAVAQVILNRVYSNKFSSSICGVVHEGVYRGGKPVRHRCSFSYWCDGKSERIRNPKAYKTALIVSHLSLQGVKIEGLDKSLYYHTFYVKPKWSKERKFLRRVGSHLFYK